MRFFWFKEPKNYGDILTPYICKRLGVKCTWAQKHIAQAIMVGSIARLARPRMRVFGSGFIRAIDPVCVEADYKWVRGPLSRQKIIDAGGVVPELYGDAALILPELIKPDEKVYDVGYIPHHVDYKDIKGVHKIDIITNSVERTTKEITRCRAVISSSLHGIIVAHAYGIPAAWVRFSDKLTGDGMKFHDHYESVGLQAILSDANNPVFQCPSQINTSHMRPLLCSQ